MGFHKSEQEPLTTTIDAKGEHMLPFPLCGYLELPVFGDEKMLTLLSAFVC